MSSIPRPVCIAFAGGNDYEIRVKYVEHAIGGPGYTMPKCWAMAAVAETLKRTDTTLLSGFMILSLSWNSIKAVLALGEGQ